MPADSQTQSEVRAVLEGQMRAYAQKDLEGVMAFYARDGDLLGIGSGPDELRQGRQEHRAALQRDFSQSELFKADITWLQVSSAGPVAWAAAVVHYLVQTGDITLEGDARLTAVLELTGSTWRIRQTHFSLPFQAQIPGQSFPQVH